MALQYVPFFKKRVCIKRMLQSDTLKNPDFAMSAKEQLLRKPWVFGDRNSHPVFRYSCLHGHLYAVHLRSLFGFNPHTTLFYHRE